MNGTCNGMNFTHLTYLNVATVVAKYRSYRQSNLVPFYDPRCINMLTAIAVFLKSITGHPFIHIRLLKLSDIPPRDIREKYFTVSSLADLFDRDDNHTAIDFIKEIHFYHQL